MWVGKMKRWIFRGKDNFLSRRLKKSRQNFCLGNRKFFRKIEFFFGKSEIFSTGIESFCDRIHDPPDFEPDWRRCVIVCYILLWWFVLCSIRVMFFEESKKAEAFRADQRQLPRNDNRYLRRRSFTKRSGGHFEQDLLFWGLTHKSFSIGEPTRMAKFQ